MRKSFVIQISFVICLLTHAACNDSSKEIINAIDNGTVLDNKFAIGGRTLTKGKTYYECVRTNKIWKLNLDTLELGFNTLQIRIWLGHSMARVNHVLVIKRVNKEWSGLLYKLKRDDGEKYESSFETIQPKSGWDGLIDSLNKLKIFTIANSSDLIGYDGNGGGDIPFHIVEIATPGKYHSYEFDVIEGYTEKFWQIKNIQLMSDLLEYEFGFQYTK